MNWIPNAWSTVRKSLAVWAAWIGGVLAAAAASLHLYGQAYPQFAMPAIEGTLAAMGGFSIMVLVPIGRAINQGLQPPPPAPGQSPP